MAPATPKSKSAASTSPRSSSKFSWSKRHRQVLLVLQRHGTKEDEIITIFNKMFEKDLRTRGLSGLTRSSVHSQLSKHYRTSCQSWKEVEACEDAELEWVVQEINALDVAGPSTVRKTSTSVVIEIPRRCPMAENQKMADRNVFKKFPEDTAISANRTRTLYGNQIPIIRATDQDLIIKDPITASEAHSAVPELLFRFYDDRSQGVRAPEGFVSSYYSSSTIPPPAPPPCQDDRLFSTILNHVNKNRFSSELVSTTSNMFFALRLAAKSNANPRVSIIRGSMLEPRKVYHAQPYARRFNNEKICFNGTFRNASSHEYLVWATLPQTAILYDFSFPDLELCLVGNPQIAAVFRIDEMRMGSSNTRLQKKFRRDALRLSSSMVEGLARLMLEFGIYVLSPGAVIARLTSEMVRGFGINLLKTTPKRWEMLADAFVYALTDNGTDVTDQQLIIARQAFLAGVRTGIGELNWHLNAQKQAKMLRKSVRLGLGHGQHMIIEEANIPDMHKVAKNSRRVVRNSQQSAIAQRRVEDYGTADKEAEIDIEEEENDEDVIRHVVDEEAIDSCMVDETATVAGTVYEDGNIEYQIDRDTINVAIPEMNEADELNEVDDAEEDTTMEEEDEAKTDNEEEVDSDAEDEIEVVSPHGRVNSPSTASRRISHPREVTRRSKRITEDVIIIDDSDDEDFLMC